MTMQTSEPLPRLSLATTSRTIRWLRHDDETVDMDQPYQRGHVWGLTRRRNLIRSLIMGVPIPSVVVNLRHLANFNEPGYSFTRNTSYAIVDGKQRITTYQMFLRGEFAVPASWFPADQVETTEDTPDGLYVRHSGLTVAGQRFFGHHNIGVSEGRFATLAEEQLIFDLVNFGGVAQGDTDDDVAEPSARR